MAGSSDDKAFVNLVRLMGGDVSVVNSAARTATRHQDSEMGEREKLVIKRLMKQRDGRAFEHAIFTFYIKCPVFIAREMMREQIGKFDDASKLDPRCYVPRKFRVPDGDSTKAADAEVDRAAREGFEQAISYVSDLYYYLTASPKPTAEQVKNGVKPGLGIAKEHAAIILPMGVYTEYRWTVSARELMRFLSLFMRPSEIVEVRVYATWFEKMFENSMPITHAAFVANGRVAP